MEGPSSFPHRALTMVRVRFHEHSGRIAYPDPLNQDFILLS